MPTKQIVMTKEIRGDLIFKEVNPRQVQFDFDDNNKILSNRNLDLSRDVCPGDFEHSECEVVATYFIKVQTIKKK